jgi:hypothetical protein
MGYEEYNFDPNYRRLPTVDFLKSHGLAGAKELDMNNYPTNLSMMFVADRFDELVAARLDQLVISDHGLRQQVKELYWQIFAGEIVLTPESSPEDIMVFNGGEELDRSFYFRIDSLYIHEELAGVMIELDAEQYLSSL